VNVDTREQPAAVPPTVPIAGPSSAPHHAARDPQRPAPQVRRIPRVVAALVALLAAVGVGLTYRLFVTTTLGQQVDELAREGAVHGQDSLWRVAGPVLDVVSESFVVIGISVAMAVALVRRRWILALQVAVLVGGANLTTQVLKRYVLDRPDLLDGWNGANSLPSGHTTIAASVSVALLLATPRSWRSVVALAGGAYTAATGVSTLVGQWHRPSDVVAAVLVVLAWGALVCAFTPASSLDVAPRRHRLPSGEPRPHAFASPGSSVVGCLLLLGAAVTGAISAAATLRLARADTLGVSPDIGAYATGALAVLAVTALAFGVLLLLRQATARPRD
jgi:membrane-associated phospholipid phosphatase